MLNPIVLSGINPSDPLYDREISLRRLEDAAADPRGADTWTYMMLHKQAIEGRSECVLQRQQVRNRLRGDAVERALQNADDADVPVSDSLRTADELEKKRLTKMIRRFSRLVRYFRRAHSKSAAKDRDELDVQEAESLVRSPQYLDRYAPSIEQSLAALPQRQHELACSEKQGKVQQRADAALEPLLAPEAMPDDSVLLEFLKAVNPVLHVKATKSPRVYRERFIAALRAAVSDLRENAGIPHKKEAGE